ncbi:hypothetical protein [Thermoleptolyngbya sp.]
MTTVDSHSRAIARSEFQTALFQTHFPARGLRLDYVSPCSSSFANLSNPFPRKGTETIIKAATGLGKLSNPFPRKGTETGEKERKEKNEKRKKKILRHLSNVLFRSSFFPLRSSLFVLRSSFFALPFSFFPSVKTNPKKGG